MTQIKKEELLEFGITCYKLDKLKEAEEALKKFIGFDPDIESFEQLDLLVKQLAKQKQHFNLSIDSRKALCYLGFIYEKQGMLSVSDNLVSDAAYDCKDPSVLIMAGNFYLNAFNADINVGLAYFIKATEIDPKVVHECDELVKSFIKNKKVWYPKSSWVLIEKYLDIWNSHRKSILKKKK